MAHRVLLVVVVVVLLLVARGPAARHDRTPAPHGHGFLENFGVALGPERHRANAQARSRSGTSGLDARAKP